jgi:hypothetical protein
MMGSQFTKPDASHAGDDIMAYLLRVTLLRLRRQIARCIAIEPPLKPAGNRDLLWLLNVGTLFDIEQQLSQPMLCLSFDTFNGFKVP